MEHQICIVSNLVAVLMRIQLYQFLTLALHEFEWDAIGKAEIYARNMINQKWNPNMTMKEFAKLSYSVIRYIEEKNLDDSVGLDNNRPPTKYLKDRDALDTDLNDEECKEFQDGYHKYSEYFDGIKSLWSW